MQEVFHARKCESGLVVPKMEKALFDTHPLICLLLESSSLSFAITIEIEGWYNCLSTIFVLKVVPHLLLSFLRANLLRSSNEIHDPSQSSSLRLKSITTAYLPSSTLILLLIFCWLSFKQFFPIPLVKSVTTSNLGYVEPDLLEEIECPMQVWYNSWLGRAQWSVGMLREVAW